MLNKLNECISRGVNFLYNEQLPDGEFPSYRIFTREGGGTWMPDTAIFPTALIAHSLRFLKGQKAHEMINRAKIFLLAEMHPPGVWKYSSKKSGITIFPDLDDTCCAAAVLLEDRPQILKNNVSRILNNRDQNGLFYTWLKPEKDGENDIDSVVNANVLFYLKEFKGIEKVVYYLYTLISEKKEEESYWYYISPAALYYMVARAYANGANRLEICAEIIANRIIQDRLASGACGNETETAMDLCTLLYFEKYDLSVMRPAIDYLIHCQHENGSWQRQQFYAGPPPPIPHAVWFGSEALTTAFCLEALSRVSIMKIINGKSTMGNNSVEHNKKIVPQRHFRAYCVGMAKSGTTSMAGLFSKYRAGHEFMFPETTKAISDYRCGDLSKRKFIAFLHTRDRLGNLEMDSASFHFLYLDILAKEYPDAKFIATIRDCYAWLDSVLNMLLVLDIKDWMIDFGIRSFGVDTKREMFSSRENLIRALPRIVDGILKYWANGLAFTLDNLPEERSLIIKTDEISYSLPKIAAFLGIPEMSLVKEKRHLFKTIKKFNILPDIDFNWLNEKFEKHCAALMQKFFPDHTLVDFLEKSQETRRVGTYSANVPEKPLAWGADSTANALFERIGDLQVDYQFERSVKISQKKLLGNRFMLGFYKSDIKKNPEERIPDICRRLDMPEVLLSAFCENLSEAEGIGFGFEKNERTRVYKAYLDFLAKWNIEIKGSLKAQDPFPAILAFKWDTQEKRKHGWAKYVWHPRLSFDGIRNRIFDIFEQNQHAKLADIANLFLERVSSRSTHDKVIYLEVEDKNGRIGSFDMNVYGANLQMKALYPLFQKILQYYSVPEDKFLPLYNQVRKMKFGHLSAGVDARGKDFVTIYFGIKRTQKA